MSKLLSPKDALTSESESARQSLFNQISVGSGLRLSGSYNFLSYSGVLPMQVPDGIRIMEAFDPHAPAHNDRIIRTIMRFASWYRPHIFIWGGDVSDFIALSRWPKMPRTPVNPQFELDQAGRLIRWPLTIKNPPYHVMVIEGNHEDMLIRFLTKNCPQFAHMAGSSRQPITYLPHLLGINHGDPITMITGNDERGGFEGGLWLNDQDKIEHGMIVKPFPVESARAHAETFFRNTAHGHVHRMGAFARDTLNGVLTGHEVACLVDFDHPYMAYARGHNWHHGFSVSNVAGGVLHRQMIPIIPATDDDGSSQFFFHYAGREWKTTD